MSTGKLIFLIAIVLLVAGGAVFFGWYKAAQLPANPNGQEKLVEVAQGMSTRAIGQKLHQEGIIRSELAFFINVRLHDDLLKAGTYRVSPAMHLNDIILAMVEGKVAEHAVTIPEGWRLTEIAKLLEDEKIVSKTDFLKAAQDKEGYLFPDTYTFGLDVTADEIVKRMRDNFDTRTDAAQLSLKRTDITLASIVEREAKNDEERDKIAAVYVNRLEQGMRLEADPTVQYAKTLADPSVTEPWPKITTADYRSVQGAYNTYLNDGLPPGPICNPGIASLKAAKNPAQTTDLYFFHTADGQTIFSKTLDEHNAQKRGHNL